MISGTILHYEILEKLGEGGMGEVYEARDTKLDRLVAVKFLPSKLTATESEKASFIQEAKAASALNHPNVCTIYDIQEHDGQLFIVMEYVDGETLRGKHNFSVKQVIDIGAQAAEGLAAAHEKGIVHRDIKPENIMLMKSGVVKVMDFGLAKFNTAADVSRLTKAGTTLGTVGYMSPEQVQGQDVDHRSDIFSLGVVLYELLSGESPFKGVHETAIMYEIVNVDPPPMSSVKEGIEPELDRVILECLEKDRNDRCQSAKELAKDLRKIRKSTGVKYSRAFSTISTDSKTAISQVQARKPSSSISIEVFNKRIDLKDVISSAYVRWGLVVILGLAAFYFAVFGGSGPHQLITSETSILPPPSVDYTGNSADPGDFEISHNGKSIVFAGTDSTGKSELWLRPLNSENAKALPGTEGAYYPFWSPDDKFVAYFIPNRLMKIDLSTGLSNEICPALDGRGGTWNQKGDIVFSPNSIGGLYLVSSNSGIPEEVVEPDTTIRDQSLRFPSFLPDGVHFLYSIENDFFGASPSDVVKVGSINSNVDKVVLSGSTNTEYAEGYLFFTKQSALLCQKFDPANLQLSADIQTVAGNVNYDATRIKASFSVSAIGNLVFLHAFQANSNLVVLNINGSQTELPVKTNVISLATPLSATNGAALSPDGRKVLYIAQGSQSATSEVCEYDLEKKLISKITFNIGLNSNPVSSPDGKMVAFTSGPDVYVKNADGSGNKKLVYKSDSAYYKTTDDWSSDGTKLLINDLLPRTGFEFVIADIKDNHIKRYLVSGNTTVSLTAAKFSHDMKWVLYASDQSGTMQIYVRPLNSSQSGMWQVSSNGGTQGWWVNNDKAIIYVTADGKVFKVSDYGSGNSFAVGSSQYLFSLNDRNLSGLSDVSRDGTEFLGTRPVGRATIPPLTFVQNWKGLIGTGGN